MTGDALGFAWVARKNGEVAISRAGRVVTTLRGEDARRFVAWAVTADEAAQQRRMARLTGNYRRGNESLARRHPRRG